MQFLGQIQKNQAICLQSAADLKMKVWFVMTWNKKWDRPPSLPRDQCVSLLCMHDHLMCDIFMIQHNGTGQTRLSSPLHPGTDLCTSLNPSHCLQMTASEGRALLLLFSQNSHVSGLFQTSPQSSSLRNVFQHSSEKCQPVSVARGTSSAMSTWRATWLHLVSN